MSIDKASHEDRRYTRQHDRILQALVQQITELNARVQFLEQTIDADTPDPSEEARRFALRRRVTSTALAEEISSIGLSLETVIASIDASHDVLDETQRRPAPTEPSVVDLSTAPRRPTWRSANARPAGWQPVASKRAG